MNQNDGKLETILRRHGLTLCPDCHTPITAANVGWNPSSEFDDVFPVVYIACKQCQKRLKSFHVKDFVQSLDEALQALTHT